MGWAIGICAALAVWAIWRDRMPRLRMWLLLFLGTVAAGWLGAVNAKIAHSLEHAGDSVTHKVLGVAVGVVIIAVLFAAEFWDRANPRNGSGGHRFGHSAMALIAPEVFLAAGGIFAGAMGISTSLLATLPSTLNGMM